MAVTGSRLMSPPVLLVEDDFIEDRIAHCMPIDCRKMDVGNDFAIVKAVLCGGCRRYFGVVAGG